MDTVLWSQIPVMTRKLYKISSFLLTLILSLAAGYAMYQISGREMQVEFVRAFLAVFALGCASFLLILARHHFFSMLVLFILSCPINCLIFITFIYYKTINTSFSSNDVLEFEQASLQDVWRFIVRYVFTLLNGIVLCGTIAIHIALGVSLIKGFGLDHATRQHLKQSTQLIPQHELDVSHKTRYLFFRGLQMQSTLGAALMVVTALVLCTQFRPIAAYRFMQQDAKANIEIFTKKAQELALSPDSKVTKQAQGELYVLVIGGALSRDNMGVYNRSIPNTLFFNSLAHNGRTVVFKNAYSSFVTTIPSVTTSFSQGNLHHGITFPQGNNLITLAHQAGIKTYWLSNHVRRDSTDNNVYALSNLADYTYFTNDITYDGSNFHNTDMVMFPELKNTLKMIDSSQNNLIIIHLLGSHPPYESRYPADYQPVKIASPAMLGKLSLEPVYQQTDGSSNFEKYLTTIKYNDLVMRTFTNLVQNRPDFQAMVYYSDHGETILYEGVDTLPTEEERSSFRNFNFSATRIPLIISYSPTFERRYPETVQALREHQNELFTNDSIYDLMLDLMQIKSDDIDYTMSIASPEYQHDDLNQFVLFNQKMVASDPEYLAFKHAHMKDSHILAINSANALMKANAALSKGYQNLHVNVEQHNNRLYVKPLAQFTSGFITLKNFVAHLDGKPRLILDLDDQHYRKTPANDLQHIVEQIGKNLLELSPEDQNRIYFTSRNEHLLSLLEKFLLEHASNWQHIPAEDTFPKASLNSTLSSSSHHTIDADTLTSGLSGDTPSNLSAADNSKLTEDAEDADHTKDVTLANNSSSDQSDLPPQYSYHLSKEKAEYTNSLGEMSIEQQYRLMIQEKGCTCKQIFHNGLPVKLVWQITALSQLTAVDKLSPMIHYIMIDEGQISSLNPLALCGRHLIVQSKNLSVQDESFAYKLSWLKRRLPGTIMIVNYHLPFDSDF